MIDEALKSHDGIILFWRIWLDYKLDMQSGSKTSGSK
jgi:hypothetical protein